MTLSANYLIEMSDKAHLMSDFFENNYAVGPNHRTIGSTKRRASEGVQNRLRMVVRSRPSARPRTAGDLPSSMEYYKNSPHVLGVECQIKCNTQRGADLPTEIHPSREQYVPVH